MPSSIPRVARTLPSIIRIDDDLATHLKKWQTVLGRTLRRPRVLKAPWNFSATNQRGGILLAWAKVAGADGYEILWTTDGDFSTGVQSIILRSGQATSYFDSIGGTGASVTVTRYYKIRALSGSINEPQSVPGILSGMVSSTSIDPSDTVTTPTVTLDEFTDDDSQTRGGMYDTV